MPEEPVAPIVETPELVLDEVVVVAPEELSDEQKTYLQENADKLTDEQKETYKTVLEEKKEEFINPEDVVPETRTPEEIKKEKKEKKEEPDEEEEEEDEEITPEDEKAIGKVVDKKTKPLTEAMAKLQKIEDRTDVDAFIRVKPEFGKYREVALKYMAHPAYKNIPVDNIMAIVAKNDLEKIGAQKEREAAKKAKDTQEAGNTAREPGKGKTDWGKASPEDFQAQRAKVFGQKV